MDISERRWMWSCPETRCPPLQLWTVQGPCVHSFGLTLSMSGGEQNPFTCGPQWVLKFRPGANVFEAPRYSARY